MKSERKISRWRGPGSRSRRGAMLPLIALILPLIIIMAAFAIDIAYMQLVRSELRTATDAAARAAARTLSLTQDQTAAIAAAKAAAAENFVANDPLLLDDADIEIGRAAADPVTSRFVFSAGGPLLNSVRVTGRRTQGSPSGPVGLFLGRFMNVPIFEPVQTATGTQIDRDIAMVLDRSGSMTDPISGRGSGRWRPCDPVPPNARWLDAAAASHDFLDALDSSPQSELVTLATYSTSASLDVNLTGNYGAIRSRVDNLTLNYCGGWTAIGWGMEQGIRGLTDASRARPFAAKSMVILTDGIHNTGPSPLTFVDAARAAGITVYTVTFSDEADQNLMRQVAEATGGKHYHAPTGAALRAAFREIALTNPTLLTD